MSFLLDDEDEQNQAQGQDDSEGVSTGSGGGVAPTTGGGAANEPAQPKQPSSSGSWTNLQSYLDANKEQGAQVGSQIAGTINEQGQKAQSALDTTSAEWNKQVNDNTVSADPDAINRAVGGATSAKAGQSLNPDDTAAFQKQYNAQYNGPTDFTKTQGFGEIQKAVGDTSRAVDQTQSEAGRNVLLGEQYKNTSKHGYNQGQNNLDQLLLENSSGGRAALEPLKEQWGGLTSVLTDTTAAGNAAAQTAATNTAAAQKTAQEAYAGANSKFQGDLTKQAQTADTTNQAQYERVLAGLKSGQLSPADIQALGLTNQAIYDVDPTKYLEAGKKATLYNSANADQYAQARALAQLAGQDESTFLPGSYSSQAGTLGPAYSFQKDSFTNAVAQEKLNYEKQLAPLNNKIADLQRQSDLLASAPFSQSEAQWVYMNQAKYGGPENAKRALRDSQRAEFQNQIKGVQKQIGAVQAQYSPTKTLNWGQKAGLG